MLKIQHAFRTMLVKHPAPGGHVGFAAFSAAERNSRKSLSPFLSHSSLQVEDSRSTRGVHCENIKTFFVVVVVTFSHFPAKLHSLSR